ERVSGGLNGNFTLAIAGLGDELAQLHPGFSIVDENPFGGLPPRTIAGPGLLKIAPFFDVNASPVLNMVRSLESYWRGLGALDGLSLAIPFAKSTTNA